MKLDPLPKPRPTFALRSPLAPDPLKERVKSFILGNERIKGIVLPGRLELHFSGNEQHLWSPQLIIDLKADGPGTRLDARFGPHPHVWTMYTGIYLILGILATLSCAFGYSQHLAEQSPTALWLLPVLLILTGLTYGAPFVGQGLSFEQMFALRTKLMELAEATELD